MNILFADLETFCTVPISWGTDVYAEQAEIIVAAWAWNDDAVETLDMTLAGEAGLRGLRKAIDRADKVVWHNARFDRTVLHHQGIDLPVEKVVDTMVLALQHSLPGALGKLCEIFRLPVDQAKDKDGKRLIRLFCQPRPKNVKIRRATRETHPEDWQKFLDYARLDIEAMRAVYKRLPKWNDIATERELWELDQKINDRGVQIDMDLVNVAIEQIAREQERLADRAADMTAGTVAAATQRDAFLNHLVNAYGIQLEDLTGATVEKVLDDPDLPAEVRDLLALRVQASTTSTAKFKALHRSTSSDGRLRGTLQFCGASRTGRWAGRVFQPQNLPRASRKTEVIEHAIEAMKRDEFDELLYGDFMGTASDAIRGCIIAPPAKKLVVADLSNIEGRVLAWLAGEDWKLQAFRDFDQGKGEDLYKLAYGRSFGVDPASVTKDQRQIGKVQELALGYEGGVGAFITFAAGYGIDLDDMAEKALPALPGEIREEAQGAWDWMRKAKRNTYGLSEQTWVACDGIKRAWRAAHPMVTEWWAELSRCAAMAIRNPGQVFTAPAVSFRKDGSWLRIILPSGRSLCYPAASLSEEGKLSYMGVNQYTRQWTRLYSYGGKLAENITQSVARDILAHGMLEAERANYSVVASIHDELLCETPSTDLFNPAGLAALMASNPAWAAGLPLAAAGFEATRYRKDG